MRTWLMGVCAALLSGSALLIAPRVEAASSGLVSLTVTIKSLALTVDAGTVGFGFLDVGASSIGAPKKVVTNTGNVAETYSMQVTNTGVLSAATTETGAAANTFVLQGLFTGSGGAAPLTGDFGFDPGEDDVVLSALATAASSTVYAWATNTDDGNGVPAAGVRDLYFKYTAPTADTLTAGALQTIEVTITTAAS